MSTFYLVYQPKVHDGFIAGLEALLRPVSQEISLATFLADITDEVALDLSVLKYSLSDIKKFNLPIPVSINIHPRSLLSDDFVHNAIELIKEENITLELIENQNVSIDDKLLANVTLLQQHGFKISVDDFGKDFASADLAIGIKADEIKFDKSLVADIEDNYSKFQHLSFLFSKMSSLCTEHIIFEGIETQKQVELIQLFVEKPTIQGFFFFRPMPLEDIVTLNRFNDNSDEESVETTPPRFGTNLDYQIYHYLMANKDHIVDSVELNRFIKKHDVLGLVHNEKIEETLKNLRLIYFSNTSIINNGIMALVNATEKLIVMRNEDGVAIFDNAAHRGVVGGSIVGINPDLLVEENESYKISLDKDKSLILDEDLHFLKDQGMFNGVTYDTIREKMRFNGKNFIITTISPKNKAIGSLSRDILTGCYNRSFFTYSLNTYENNILAFLDMNGFKAINDTFGHLVGDQCLVEFANILTSSLRATDTVVRYGGDEFVLIFNTLDHDRIDNKLNGINEKIQSHFEEKGYELSFSHGLAKIEDHNLQAAIEEADKKMYAAKQKFKQEKNK